MDSLRLFSLLLALGQEVSRNTNLHVDCVTNHPDIDTRHHIMDFYPQTCAPTAWLGPPCTQALFPLGLSLLVILGLGKCATVFGVIFFDSLFTNTVAT